ncbi:hypothetical protein [Streptomyces dysideae]|uniref:hypothetical protein n=1 Tax=Streptomyces dysideae TaxID=909626 RepID=UPI000A667321|nr:hypothetical protein [Streptomyces dysideae]
MTQPTPQQEPLWRRYQEPDDRGLIDDVCDGLRLITEPGPDDPGQILALAIVGAEAAEGLAAALEDEWALYTPQQAAVTASALFAQIAAAGAALEKLSDCLDVMAGRGEITASDYDGAGEAERLCTAQTVLGAAGQEAFGAIDAHDCDEAVDILATTPYTGPLPVSTHETFVQLAGLLGESAKLIPGCRPPAEAVSPARDYEDGCGCRIELTDRDSIVWDFHRSDGTWYFMPLADATLSGRPLAGKELSMTQACPHPQHLALLVQQTLSAAEA